MKRLLIGLSLISLLSGCGMVAVSAMKATSGVQEVNCGNGLTARLSVQRVKSTAGVDTLAARYTLNNPTAQTVTVNYPSACTAPTLVVNGIAQPSDRMCAQVLTQRTIGSGMQPAFEQQIAATGVTRVGIQDRACPAGISVAVR